MCVSRWLEVVLCPWWGEGGGLAGGGGLPAGQSAVPCQPGASERSESSTVPVARLQSPRQCQGGGQKNCGQTNPEVRHVRMYITDGPMAALVDQLFSVFVLRCPSELGLSSTSSVKVEEVEEGAEPSELVKALGGQDKKAYDCMLQGASPHPTAT